MNDKSNTKVIVGLSGGVDSAASVIRLKEEGYNVEAIYMRNWDSALNNDLLGNPTVMDEVCPQEKDYQDAVKVASKLGITGKNKVLSSFQLLEILDSCDIILPEKAKSQKIFLRHGTKRANILRTKNMISMTKAR